MTEPVSSERRQGRRDRRRRLLKLLRQPSSWAGIGLVATALGWNVEAVPLLTQLLIAGAGLAALMLDEN